MGPSSPAPRQRLPHIYVDLDGVVRLFLIRSKVLYAVHATIIRGRPGVLQEFRSLFRFSFLFSLSTRFLCIFSASFSYLSRSSLAALLSLMACTRL